MPTHFVLLMLALIVLYIWAEAFFDITQRLQAFWRRTSAKLRAKPAQSAKLNAATADLRSQDVISNAPAPARKIPWQSLAQLAAVLIVVVVLAGIANRFTTSPAEVREGFRADAAIADGATQAASVDLERKTIVRLETHHADLHRLEGDLNDARTAIADAADLDARVAAARAHFERMRIEAEAARAAAVLELDPGRVS